MKNHWQGRNEVGRQVNGMLGTTFCVLLPHSFLFPWNFLFVSGFLWDIIWMVLISQWLPIFSGYLRVCQLNWLSLPMGSVIKQVRYSLIFTNVWILKRNVYHKTGNYLMENLENLRLRRIVADTFRSTMDSYSCYASHLLTSLATQLKCIKQKIDLNLHHILYIGGRIILRPWFYAFILQFATPILIQISETLFSEGNFQESFYVISLGPLDPFCNW